MDQIGIGLGCVGIAVAIVSWLLPPDWVTPRLRATIISIACAVGLFGIVLIVYDFFAPKHEQSNVKPHLTMIPSIGMLHNQPSVAVMFHNRGRDELDKLTLKVIPSIDGKEISDLTTKEVSILRPNTNRQLFIGIPRQTFDAVLTGKMTLKVMASAAYSFHGIPFMQTCLTQFDAEASFFDHIDC